MYCHKVLHNHDAAVESFDPALAQDTAEFEPESRMGKLQDRLHSLLRTAAFLHSPLKVPIFRIWCVGEEVYVTGSDTTCPSARNTPCTAPWLQSCEMSYSKHHCASAPAARER